MIGPTAVQAAKVSPVFHARGLSKTYRMGDVEVHALRDVDLDIVEGEFVVLLGPSGSGKSTLLNILGGLDAPTSGEACWRDHNLVGADDAELTRYRREHVGFVFQFYNLIPSLTVLENVALVNEIAEKPLDPREVLSLVGLEGRLDHFPSQLSGGERRRVAVARAIVNRRTYCCAMSPPARWTTKPARSCSRPLCALTNGSALQRSLSPIMRRLPAWPTACSGSGAGASLAKNAMRAVYRLMRCSGDLLDRKLLRDLNAMRAQVITIALLVAAGVAVFVGSVSTYQSLRAGCERFYRDARFPQIFVTLSGPRWRY